MFSSRDKSYEDEFLPMTKAQPYPTTLELNLRQHNQYCMLPNNCEESISILQRYSWARSLYDGHLQKCALISYLSFEVWWNLCWVVHPSMWGVAKTYGPCSWTGNLGCPWIDDSNIMFSCRDKSYEDEFIPMTKARPYPATLELNLRQ